MGIVGLCRLLFRVISLIIIGVDVAGIGEWDQKEFIGVASFLTFFIFYNYNMHLNSIKLFIKTMFSKNYGILLKNVIILDRYHFISL